MKVSFDAVAALMRELSSGEQFALVNSDNQPALKNFLNDLLVLTTRPQWTVDIDEATGQYTIMNLGPNGERRYYMVSPGQYGEPVITPEPDLAFSVPVNLTYVNKKGEAVVPAEKISGIICQESHRFSLTNAKNKGIDVTVNDDGSIQVGDETWWLSTLFIKDKNRVRNYDAYLVREKPPQVKVLELADLDLF